MKKPSALRAFFEKHREIIMYLVFGVLTTVVSWLVFSVCEILFRGNVSTYIISIISSGSIEAEIFSASIKMSVLLANIISWVIAVSFAFVTNKVWVFDSRSWRAALVTKEAMAFVGGRAITGILEIIAVPLLEGIGLNKPLFGVEGLPAKMIVSIVIVILNYIISKFGVFRTRGATGA